MILRSENKPVMVPREVVNDAVLSLEEIGFMAYLSSKPDDYEIDALEIASDLGYIPAFIHSLLEGLINRGHLEDTDQ